MARSSNVLLGVVLEAQQWLTCPSPATGCVFPAHVDIKAVCGQNLPLFGRCIQPEPIVEKS